MKPYAMIFVTDSITKKLVMTISIMLRTWLRLEFGSFKGLSTAMRIVEMNIKDMMNGSKYLWFTILAMKSLKLFSGPRK